VDVILRTGVTAESAIQALSERRQRLQDPRNAFDEPVEVPSKPGVFLSARINSYLAWVQDTETRLRELFADTELVGGLFWDRYWHIAGLPIGAPYGTRIINQELDHQAARLASAIERLTRWQKLGEREGELLVLDTNSMLEFRPFYELPWREILGSGPILLTMPVVDELEAKKRGTDKRLRKRARNLLPRIDMAFGETDQTLVPVLHNDKPQPGVTIEILRDEPGQYRPTTDKDEAILDRAEFLQQAAGRPVIVVTWDTGMKIRSCGRSDGLKRLTLPEKYRLKDADETDA
jgi:hypothetical protein